MPAGSITPNSVMRECSWSKGGGGGVEEGEQRRQAERQEGVRTRYPLQKQPPAMALPKQAITASQQGCSVN